MAQKTKSFARHTHSVRLDPEPAVDRGKALGQSEAFLAFQERLSRVARVNRPVLLVGERGTGKELAAARLHHTSPRWQGPLVTLNCAALSPTLIESELFGYEEGAFTGATRRRSGRFEAAHGGTLFLDEIGQIPLEVQAKILRVVEYGVFERVGSTQTIRLDVRIVGATNADLVALATVGKFQRDLLDRLSFEVLRVPPLRERQGDIPLLANYFAGHMALELGQADAPEFSEAAMTALEAYSWPGNVRELKNVVERAVCRSDSALITEIVFDPFAVVSPPSDTTVAQEDLPVTTPASTAPASLPDAVQALETQRLRQALSDARYNQRRAAQLLGLSYHQFRALYRKHRAAVER